MDRHLARGRRCFDAAQNRNSPGSRRQNNSAWHYTLFIDLKENKSTFVVSIWPAIQHWDPDNKTELSGWYFTLRIATFCAFPRNWKDRRTPQTE